MIEKKLFKKSLIETLKIGIYSSIISCIINHKEIYLDYTQNIEKGLKKYNMLVFTAFISFSIAFTFSIYLSLITRFRLHRNLNSIKRYILEIFILFLISSLWNILFSILFYDFKLILLNIINYIDSLIYGFLISFIVYTILLFLITLNSFVGMKYFFLSLIGYYQKPKIEKRIIAFIDLRNSTSIAEKLGRDLYFDFLDKYLALIEFCSLYFNAEIHKYVGDCVIVSWKYNEKNIIKVLNFAKQLIIELSERKDPIRNKYKVDFSFSVGIYHGEVTIAEIGDTKRELGFWGDTMNTTQRIQEYCKNVNEIVLIDEAIFDKNIIKDYKLYENVQLKGKDNLLNLYAIKV